MAEGTFIGRQPILDRDQRVVAYEILYRSSQAATAADFADFGQAAVRVMLNTFASLGADAVLGRSLGFFNVTRELLLSELVEALPSDRVVIEVLETVEADDEVVARCRELGQAGFKIAIDDWVMDDPREALLSWAHVVKVDFPGVPRKDLRKLVRKLCREDVLLLAEKVEEPEEFALCHDLGFDRFQGYYFAKPVVIEGADLDAGKATLLNLLQQVNSEVDLAVIVESFKQDAKLGLNLLRLVNSAGTAARVQLESLVHELHLDEGVARALTHHEGDLGDLLTLSFAIEVGEVDKVESELGRWHLEVDELQGLENDAYAWVHSITQSSSLMSAQ